MNLHLSATITDRVIKIEGDPCILCNNDDYVLSVNFDAEWSDIHLKTARFVAVSGKETTPIDVVFEGNTVSVPPISNAELVYVGIFAGDIRATTKAGIRCEKSILCGSGTPATPTPDVYAQIMELFNEVKGESAFIRYSFNANGEGYTDEWMAGQRYIGFATSIFEPIDKSLYHWVEVVPDVEQIDRAERAAENAEKVISETEQAKDDANDAAALATKAAKGVITIEQNKKTPLRFWVGTQAEYDKLTESEKSGMFALITDDMSEEQIGESLASLAESIRKITAGETAVGFSLNSNHALLADNASMSEEAKHAQDSDQAVNAKNDENGINFASNYAKLFDIIKKDPHPSGAQILNVRVPVGTILVVNNYDHINLYIGQIFPTMTFSFVYSTSDEEREKPHYVWQTSKLNEDSKSRLIENKFVFLGQGSFTYYQNGAYYSSYFGLIQAIE